LLPQTTWSRKATLSGNFFGIGNNMNISRASQVDLFFRKIIRKDSDEISLDADMIRLLIAIDENKSLYQIAEEVDMETTTLKKTLSKLLDQGLIEPVKKDVPYLDHVFREALRINLSKVIGPMAEILIEDVVAEMELKTSEIPVNQAAELINNLSLEIPDEKDRIDFKKSMLSILNKR
jgi:predicted transcriptional regulator